MEKLTRYEVRAGHLIEPGVLTSGNFTAETPTPVYLAADVDARALPWSTDKPKVEGWYWWRDQEIDGRAPEVCHIYKGIDGELCVNWTTDCYTNGTSLEDYDLGQWAGPLAEPLPMEGGGK